MNYREPNFNELFPSSYHKKLINIQSTHFVNNSLAKGGITSGFEGIPTSVPISETLDNDLLKIKIAESLVGTYFKNNWKVMLTCAALGAAAIFLLIKINEENQKKKKQKLIFYKS